MLVTHPFCTAASLIFGLYYSIHLNGKKAVRFSLAYMLPLLVIAALVNPAFSHQGVTILAYLPSGNPLTLESILYGLAAALMLICVITWFSSFNAVMTGDKLIYLFGRVIPSLSLILSMSLRFVPRFIAQARVIANAQRCVGRDMGSGSVLRRARNGVRILSILVTWALENAIDTADSMKARGFGLKGRTAFAIYRLTKRDIAALAFLSSCLLFILVAGVLMQNLAFSYYPVVTGVKLGAMQAAALIAHLALCAMPLLLNVREGWRWKRISQSSMSRT
jgi:energy-coupling factor transport system permease protein